MRIFSLDDQMITDGQNAYHQYRTAMLSGPRSLTYDAGMRRMTGVQVVAGAIIACLEDGIDSEAEIITVVSRVSRCRCRSATVSSRRATRARLSPTLRESLPIQNLSLIDHIVLR